MKEGSSRETGDIRLAIGASYANGRSTVSKDNAYLLPFLLLVWLLGVLGELLNALNGTAVEDDGVVIVAH